MNTSYFPSHNNPITLFINEYAHFTAGEKMLALVAKGKPSTFNSTPRCSAHPSGLSEVVRGLGQEAGEDNWFRTTKAHSGR